MLLEIRFSDQFRVDHGHILLWKDQQIQRLVQLLQCSVVSQTTPTYQFLKFIPFQYLDRSDRGVSFFCPVLQNPHPFFKIFFSQPLEYDSTCDCIDSLSKFRTGLMMLTIRNNLTMEASSLVLVLHTFKQSSKNLNDLLLTTSCCQNVVKCCLVKSDSFCDISAFVVDISQ